jgi:hypothetical protein
MTFSNDSRFTRLSLFCGLVLGVGQTQAGEVHTPAMRLDVGSGTPSIRCFATNVSRHVEEATLTVYSRFGIVPGSPDEPHPLSATITVQPNETYVFGGFLISTNETARCSLSGTGVNPKDWRLSICLFASGVQACLKGD